MRIVLPVIALLLTCGGIARSDGAASADGGGSELKLAADVSITTAISVEALKRTFRDPRPVGSGYAFPSGHATLAFGLARVASHYHPERRTLWYALAAGVAWSRVRTRAHTWDDVIAGAALGSWIGDTAVARGGIVLVSVGW